jgi:tetratricopeptide (TPR) repeat protein
MRNDVIWKRIFGILIVFIPLNLHAQIYDSSTFLDRGQHYFGAGYYHASWQASILETSIYETPNTFRKKQFNTLSNALRLNLSGAEKMLTLFKENYPTERESLAIDFDVANYYFANEEYRYALKWYLKIDESYVPKLEQPTFQFNKGYSLFSAGRYAQAKPFLEKVKTNKNFESDAHYYLGHIAYQLNDYDNAFTEFSATSDREQKENLRYFQADMNFRLGRFEQAIALGKEILTNGTEDTYSELSKIIGESYFNLKQYQNALGYLKNFKGKKGKWSNEDLYQLGYTYYRVGEYENAMDQFNKIVGEKNALSQNAYYHLADCYLKIGNKPAALTAFKSAFNMGFDSILQENAFLNYAKLSYEIGNPFEETPNVLVSFLERYPKNESVELIEELLIDSYTQNANYDAAISILEEKGDFKNDYTLQKVYVLKGIASYNSADYKNAEKSFRLAQKNKENKFLQAYALYWLGKSLYELNKFDQALSFFKEFKNHPMSGKIEIADRLQYDIGYTYFKLNEYESALAAFETFNLNNSTFSAPIQRDTFLRIGDCNFALKQYWPAMEHYNTAIAFDESNGAYPSFQKAISYGFIGRNAQKIETLTKLIERYKTDPLVDDALFELAIAYSLIGENQKAIISYDDLLSSYQRSPYLAQSSLNKALILYNDNQLEKAQTLLQDIVVRYKGYAVAEQGIRTLREIAIDIGQVNEFSTWLKSQNLESLTDIDLEKTTFDAAEKQFLSGKFKIAEKLFEDYLSTFSKGIFSIPVTFYLAELNFSNEMFEKALDYYAILVESEVSIYTEKALVRSITILKNQSQLLLSIPYLEKLEEVATSEENKRFALINLMHAYFESKNYDKTLQCVEKVFQLSELEEVLLWDARYLKAKAAMLSGDIETAGLMFEKLENAPKAEWAAEAFYFKALKLYESNSYTESNEYIQKIALSIGGSGYWNAKALVLLAKNYWALEDSFQAIFVLESILENFDQFEAINDEASKLLDEFQKASQLNEKGQ